VTARQRDLVPVVVAHYDEAIAFFVNALDHLLVEDTPLGHGRRWVVVAPADPTWPCLLITQAAGPRGWPHPVDQTRTPAHPRRCQPAVCFGRRIQRRGVRAAPSLSDLYGNRWDVISSQLGHPYQR